ncbi:ribosome hibernation-promoting factor, HPF/YfiA family [Thalassorhabdus alkalitolerans]|uniref:Ribosome hibernation promoting factor n=1 Tax=Thalassorhabdus alkalitolerans TaxID=2282697 RepID=A0ABW0YMC3_9BACI|nr:ribosome-associated translation inhibitor RaiA [Thalassobacillus sp. C254]
MEFVIRGKGMEVTESLREYSLNKLQRIERFLDQANEAVVHVTLKVTRNQQGVEVTIPNAPIILRAEEMNKDMYAAIDAVIEKLERQMKKYKTKVNRKFRNDNSLKAMNSEEYGGGQAVLTEDPEEIIRKKRFALKPMDEEEAILQMNMLDHQFFVYKDMETNETNVVYRRHDGRYGLIQGA